MNADSSFLFNMNLKYPIRQLPLLAIMLSILAVAALSLTTQPLFELNNNYIETGSATVSTAPWYQNSSVVGTQNHTFDVPYSRVHTSYRVMTSIQSISMVIQPNLLINHTILPGLKYTTKVIIVLISNTSNYCSSLEIRYMVLDGTFNKLSPLYLSYYITVNGTNNNRTLSSAAPIYLIYGLSNVINQTGTIRTFVVITGLNVTLSSPTPVFDIDIVGFWDNVNYPNMLLLNITSTSAIPVYVHGLNFQAIYWNEYNIEQWPFPAARIYYNQIPSNGDTVTSFSSNNYMESYNTFWGLSATTILSQPLEHISWASKIAPLSEFKAAVSNSTYQRYTLIMIIFKECNSTTPYYLISQDLCYDPCPVRYFANTSIMTCDVCAYDCYQCTDSNTCISCNVTTDNRALQVDRCVPIDGFFDDGSNNTAAQPCDPSCLTCSVTSTTCLSCPSGFTLSSSTCVNSSCPYDCLTCDSVTLACLSCNASNNRVLLNGSCLPIDGFFDDGSNNTAAQPCDPSCLTCSVTSTTCLSCPSGFTLSSSTCVNSSCPYDCLTCDSVTLACLSCNASNNRVLLNGSCLPIDGFFDDGSNNTAAQPCDPSCLTCSVTSTTCLSCPSGFTLSSSTCVNSSCPYDCLTCDSVTLACLSCNSSNNRVLLNGSCLPIDGFFDDGSNNTAAQPCDPSCLTCSVTSTTCLSCPSGFTLSSSTCVNSSCPYDCLTCDSVTLACLSCNASNNRVLLNGSCLPIDGFFDDGSNNTAAQPCDPSCLTCSVTSTTCLSCPSGFTLSSATCIIGQNLLCGDGLLNFGQICDDGNSQSGDGCSQHCQVQDNFICNGTKPSGASECYLLTLSINYSSTIKDPNQNTFTMYFDPYPSSLSSLYQDLDWNKILSVSQDSPLQQVIIKDISYNPSTGKIEIKVDYSEDATNKEIKLDTNYNSIQNISSNSSTASIFSLLNPAVLSTTLKASNNLALDYYEDNNYQLASTVRTIAQILSALALLVSLVGLLGAKLIGLEMIAVFQLSFLFILSLDNMSPVMDALGGLQMSVGYNKLGSYDTFQNLDPEFIAIEFNQSFIKNYNITVLFIALPLLMALIFKILTKAFSSNEQRAKRMQRYFQLSIGQFTFYGFMFSGYLVFVSLTISLLQMSKGSSDFVGLSMGAVFIILAIVYQIALYKKPDFFGEFKDKFRLTSINSHFYNILIFQRIISGILLGFITWLSFQSVTLATIYIVELALIAIKQPYKGKRSNLRPIANMSIIILISIIYYLMNNMEQATLKNYGPLAVIALLATTLTYSTILLVLELKEKFSTMCQEQAQQEEMTDEMKKISANNNSNLKSSRNPLLNITETDPDSLSPQLSPARLISGQSEATSIKKEQLNAIKNTIKMSSISPIGLEAMGQPQQFDADFNLEDSQPIVEEDFQEEQIPNEEENQAFEQEQGQIPVEDGKNEQEVMDAELEVGNEAVEGMKNQIQNEIKVQQSAPVEMQMIEMDEQLLQQYDDL